MTLHPCTAPHAFGYARSQPEPVFEPAPFGPPVAEHEARFLSLGPQIVTLLDEFDQLWAPTKGLYAIAEAAFPDRYAGDWNRAKEESPQWAAYSAAWHAASAVGQRADELFEPFNDLPMTSIEAILLRHRIGMSFEHLRQDVLQDLDAIWRARGCRAEIEK